MSDKQYFTASAVVFTVVALAHLVRVLWRMEATVMEYEVPLWASGVAAVIAAYLATRGFFAAYRYEEPLFAVRFSRVRIFR